MDGCPCPHNTVQRYVQRRAIYGPRTVYKKQCSLSSKAGELRTRRIVSMLEAVFWNNTHRDKDVSPVTQNSREHQWPLTLPTKYEGEDLSCHVFSPPHSKPCVNHWDAETVELVVSLSLSLVSKCIFSGIWAVMKNITVEKDLIWIVYLSCSNHYVWTMVSSQFNRRNTSTAAWHSEHVSYQINFTFTCSVCWFTAIKSMCYYYYFHFHSMSILFLSVDFFFFSRKSLLFTLVSTKYLKCEANC